MTIDEAIKVNEDTLRKQPFDFAPDAHLAMRLGIEALTFLERWRDKAEIKPYPLLPSETTD